jgi:hypothetical protein
VFPALLVRQYEAFKQVNTTLMFGFVCWCVFNTFLMLISRRLISPISRFKHNPYPRSVVVFLSQPPAALQQSMNPNPVPRARNQKERPHRAKARLPRLNAGVSSRRNDAHASIAMKRVKRATTCPMTRQTKNNY